MFVHVVRPGLARETEIAVKGAMQGVRNLEKLVPRDPAAPETVVLVIDASEPWPRVLELAMEALADARRVYVEKSA